MKRSPYFRPLLLGTTALLAQGCFALPARGAIESPSAESSSVSDFSLKQVTLSVGNFETKLSSDTLYSLVDIRPKRTFKPDARPEMLRSGLCPFPNNLCGIAFSLRFQNTLRYNHQFSINDAALQVFISKLGEQTGEAPVDAKFTVEDGKVSAFALSQDGWELDQTKAMEALGDAFHKHSQNTQIAVSLPTRTIPAAIQSNDADHLGIVELIGEGRTNFAGSPKNRVHNFKHAAEQFNGVIIPPRSEFSFVEHLGPVDGEHGYLPELVIKHNKTEPEFGGGICQVSSTVFRAAIRSGLKITARRNHAYPVRYYTPYGMDATIYIPNPDLKFVNNTPGSILMQSSIEGNELVFRFYGTSDGRQVEVDGPHILESNPDGSMKTVFTQKVTDAQGATIINDDFRSNYASPSKYPHPGQEPVLTEKPGDWSERQWRDYKNAHSGH